MTRPGYWRGKRVLVTGHTGFKGGWLCLWLKQLGADVAGEDHWNEFHGAMNSER